MELNRRFFSTYTWTTFYEFFWMPAKSIKSNLLSPYFESLMMRIRINKRDKNYNGTLIHTGSAYPDDLVLFFLDNANLQNGLNILKYTFSDFELTINATKTNSIIFDFNAKEEYLKTICSMSNNPIENVKAFKYLGAILHCDQANVGDEEIQHCISAAQRFLNNTNICFAVSKSSCNSD